MATLFELQQAQQQKTAQQAQQRSAIIGSVVQTAGMLVGAVQSGLAEAIGAIGGAAIGLSQFFKTQAQAKQQERITAHQKFVSSNVDNVLSILYQAGNDLIDKDFNPLTPDFEQSLYTILYP